MSMAGWHEPIRSRMFDGLPEKALERNDREDAGFRDRQQMLVDSDGGYWLGGTQAL